MLIRCDARALALWVRILHDEWKIQHLEVGYIYVVCAELERKKIY